ncbi:MAG: leucine-rich repeat protein [Clostridia bacterium]|nr:leucine-rich repeat protein [Clostridia bacterium]
MKLFGKSLSQKTKLIIILAIEFIAISIILLLIFFAGKKSYTVTFDLNGGILISGEAVQRVTQGQSATPPNVAKDGHYLRGWSGSYHKVTRDSTVKAIWEYETTPGIIYSDAENQNYCEIIGSYKGLRGEVYIGAYHDEKMVLGITEGAFKGRNEITAMHLLDGILAIEAEAFAGCTKMETIEIPSTVVKIGKNAFAGCESLTEIVLPSDLVTIEAGAFAGCSSLTEIVIPEGVEVIETGAFDTEGLIINVYFDEGEMPEGFADGWHKGKIVYGYEPPLEETEAQTKNDPWWNKDKDKDKDKNTDTDSDKQTAEEK